MAEYGNWVHPPQKSLFLRKRNRRQLVDENQLDLQTRKLVAEKNTLTFKNIAEQYQNTYQRKAVKEKRSDEERVPKSNTAKCIERSSRILL